MKYIRGLILAIVIFAVGVFVGRSRSQPVAGFFSPEIDLKALGLRGTHADVQFDGVPFPDALKSLEKLYSRAIELDQYKTEELPSIQLNLRQVDLETALDQICAKADDIGWDIYSNRIFVTRRRHLCVTTQLYDIAPLLARLANEWKRLAPNPPIPPPPTGNSQAYLFYGEPTIEELVDQVKKLMIDNVAPVDWKDNGGEISSCSTVTPGLLLITTTPRTHDQIKRLFNDIMMNVGRRWILTPELGLRTQNPSTSTVSQDGN